MKIFGSGIRLANSNDSRAQKYDSERGSHFLQWGEGRGKKRFCTHKSRVDAKSLKVQMAEKFPFSKETLGGKKCD